VEAGFQVRQELIILQSVHLGFARLIIGLRDPDTFRVFQFIWHAFHLKRAILWLL